MIDLEDIKLYKQYLNTVQELLNQYFEDQKEYICCHKGCSHCCETGQYPYSELEFNYLMLGFFNLPMEKKQEVLKRIKGLKENNNNKMYRCPFLSEEKTCLVYDFRGIICRTFGLLKPDKNGEIITPFCRDLGLNYSKVYNKDENMLDMELVEKEGYKKTPKAYNISMKFLTSEDIFEGEPLHFGEIKSLIDWL